MADVELVAYLRKHLGQFGAEAMRRQLLSQGIPEAEVEAAFNAASKPASKKPRMIVYVVFTAALLGFGAFLMMDSGQQKSSSNSEIKESPEHMFMGHNGYVIRVPSGYSVLSDFKNSQRTREVVYLYPKGIETANLLNEGLYGQLGILRLEISPRLVPEGKIGMDAVRAGVVATLQGRKTVFTSQEIQVVGLSAFLIHISHPTPLVQAFVVGTKMLYILTGGIQDQLFNDTLNSLQETSVENRPATPTSAQ